MSKTWNKIAIVCVLMSALGITYALGEIARSHRSFEEAIQRRDTTARSIESYRQLSSVQQDTLLSAKPQQDVETRIGEAIDHAAISPRPRYRVSVQGDQAYQSTSRGSTASRSAVNNRLREQRVSIQIPNLTVKQIGQVLVYWREQQQVWAPLRIELQHDQRSTANQYTLQMDCQAVYYADGE